MTISCKRIYEEALPEDGFRVLVDRLWPRGISKERAKLDLWLKEIAPSTELRKSFQHLLQNWPAFVKNYRLELSGKKDLLNFLREKSRQEKITLLFAARDLEHNEAIVLQELLLDESSQEPEN